MPRPSIFQQLPGSVQVDPEKLLPSPRHWNAGMIRFSGKLLLAYRHHVREPGSRCAIALCEISEKTFQPTGKSQVLALKGPVGGEHHEDARLFIFRDQLHISYTEMRGYRPGVDYQCVVKYARLKKAAKGVWKIEEVFQPKWGQNSGYSKEKNWVFFEQGGKLYCIYQTFPKHVVLEMDGSKVVQQYITPAPHWAWGTPRGGASPIAFGTHFLHIFHSSLPTEDAPFYVRYYAGAYKFDNKPPFAISRISSRPIAVGSEEDGHQVDPRYVDGWKPFVVFPCGIVTAGQTMGEWFISMGVNDWQTVISPISLKALQLMAADGSEVEPRFIRTVNGNRPVPMVFVEGGNVRTEWLEWEVPTLGLPGGAGTGYMRLTNERVAEELVMLPYIEEIEEATYLSAMGSVARR